MKIQWSGVDWEQEGFAGLAWWPYLSLIAWQEALYSENLNKKSRLPIAYFITSTFLRFSIRKEFAVQLYVSQSQGQFKNSKSKLKLCEYNQNYLLEISAPCQFDHGNQETKNEFKLQSFEPISIAQTNVVGIHCLLLLIWLATNVEVALVTTLYILSLFQCQCVQVFLQLREVVTSRCHGSKISGFQQTVVLQILEGKKILDMYDFPAWLHSGTIRQLKLPSLSRKVVEIQKFCFHGNVTLPFSFNFSWYDCNTQEKLETMVMQNFGGIHGALWSMWKWWMGQNVVNLICRLFVVRLHLFNSYSRINSSVTKGNKFPEKVTLNIMLIILLVIKT